MNIYNTPIFIDKYNNCQNKFNDNLSFKSNPDSLKLVFNQSDFFIRIKNYRKDMDWAAKVIKLTDKAVILMRKGETFDKVLSSIAKNMRHVSPHRGKFNFNHTGVLRTIRKGYGVKGPWNGKTLQTPYDRKGDKYFEKVSQYFSFKSVFDKVFTSPLKAPYDDISLTRIGDHPRVRYLEHGNADKINNALDRVGKIYKNIQKKYIKAPKNVTRKSLKDINSDIAEIRWIMAHATPWERGSDSISNVFMRALYKSMGIKTYPAKKGISFDLQAYYTELEDYKKNFVTYFEKKPKVIEERSFISSIISFFKKDKT